jgi:hypothetical protein
LLTPICGAARPAPESAASSVLHIDEQGVQFRRIELGNGFGDLQEHGIAHSKNRFDSHLAT